MEQPNEINVHCGKIVSVKKCTYCGYAATIYSVEHAISVLDHIGQMTNSEDYLPFALSLVEGGELISICEDNGAFGGGDLLSGCLQKLEGYNVLVCVSRRILDCYVMERIQGQVHWAIREAASNVLSVLRTHLTNSGNQNFIGANFESYEFPNAQPRQEKISTLHDIAAISKRNPNQQAAANNRSTLTAQKVSIELDVVPQVASSFKSKRLSRQS